MNKHEVLKNLGSYRRFAESNLTQLSWDFSGPSWKPGTKHFMVQEQRYYLVLKKIAELYPDTVSSILDVGCYPGEIGAMLRKLYGDSSKIYGCGLHFTEEFKQKASAFYNELFYTELDPLNPLGSNTDQTRVALPDGSIELVIACEIFEHLYNPLHFIEECSRLLSDTGSMILTTDNLKYIGNILGIIRNKTVFSELKDSHIFMKSEWRPHERLYLKREIEELFDMFNLTVKEHFFFDNCYERYEKLPLPSRINQTVCKMFYIIPSFRPRHFFILQKKPSVKVP